jgi:hypothetical protein
MPVMMIAGYSESDEKQNGMHASDGQPYLCFQFSHWPSDRGWKKEEKRCPTRNLCEPQTLAKSAKTAKIEMKLTMSAKQACQRTMLELMSWDNYSLADENGHCSWFQGALGHEPS